MRPLLIATFAFLTFTGCKKEETAPQAPAAAPAAPAAAPEAQPSAAAPGAAGEKQLVGKGQMQHCPTAVKGATVAIDDTEGGVLVTVTSTVPADVTEIRTRAKHLATAAEKPAAEVRHTGEGEGGGSQGRCAIVLKDTTVAVEEVPNGAKLTVKPTRTDDLAWLSKEARARHEAQKAQL